MLMICWGSIFKSFDSATSTFKMDQLIVSYLSHINLFTQEKHYKFNGPAR